MNYIMSRKHFKIIFCRQYEKDRIMIYDFGVDYDAIAVDNILDIQKYLMKKNGIV